MVTRKYVDPDGYPLGQWILKTRQQKLNGRLKEERIAQLDEIGMVWSVFDAKWEKAYALAAAYYNVPAEYVSPGGCNLGNWVKRQRYTRQNPEKSRTVLTEERIAKLNEIGMRWKTRNPKSQKSCLKLKEKIEPAKAG